MSQENKNYSTLVSQNIKYWREACGLSQERLAKEIGVSESAISLYESGKREPDIETLGKLAEALHLNITELFLKPGEQKFYEKELKEKVSFELYAIMGSIEQLICTTLSKHWVREEEINIVDDLISIWRYARESYNKINEFRNTKKQWIPNGRKIKTLLKEKNVGLRDLAAHLNMTEGNTDMLLYGIKPVSVDVAVRIAMFLNCTVEEIVRYSAEEE